MKNPWIVLTSREGIEKPFPTKKAAADYAARWVEDHPGDETLVMLKKGRQIRLHFWMQDDEVQSSRRGLKQGPPATPGDLHNTAAIDAAIRAKGFTRSDARKIRQAVIDSWTAALQRGETVETPVGQISVVPAPRQRQRFDQLKYKRTGEWDIQRVFEKRRKRIRFKPNKKIFPNPKATPILPPPVFRRSIGFATNPFWPVRNPYRRY